METKLTEEMNEKFGVLADKVMMGHGVARRAIDAIIADDFEKAVSFCAEGMRLFTDVAHGFSAASPEGLSADLQEARESIIDEASSYASAMLALQTQCVRALENARTTVEQAEHTRAWARVILQAFDGSLKGVWGKRGLGFATKPPPVRIVIGEKEWAHVETKQEGADLTVTYREVQR